MLNEKICSAIDNQKETLLNLSHAIHEHPEVRFTEKTAVKLIKEVLEANGFDFLCPWAGLDTAFKAVYHGKPGGPTLAFLAEYDALEKIGHGCGHNLIATMSVGAALGIKTQMQDITGDIVIMGCPGEEGGKGKVIMLNNNGFDGIDYAMMIHPADYNMIQRTGLAAVVVDVEFIGQSAHSKQPSDGINALTALIQMFNGIDARRQCWADKTRCNGIITDGGTASNVVPDYAAGKFTVRASTVAELEKVVDDMENIAKAAELMVGAKVNFKPGYISSERYCNLAMDERLKAHVQDFGIEMQYPPKNLSAGSSDFGNVSMKLPGIHAYLSIAEQGEKIKNHTKEFTAAAISKKADDIILIGAKSLAMTAYDILTDTALQKDISAEFAKVPKR